MRVLIVSEKAFEISAIRGYFGKLPFNDADTKARVDFYEAKSGKEGIDKYEADATKDFHYDLVVISQKMKAFSGLMTAQGISGKKKIPTPAMILLTENVDKLSVANGVKAGILGFLKIPYNLEDFKKVLENIGEAIAAREERKRLLIIANAQKQGSTVNLEDVITAANQMAIGVILKAKDYAPWNNGPLITVSSLLVGAGEYKTAIPILKNAIKLDFADKRPHKLLQECYQNVGMHKEELSSLKRLLSDNPKSSELNGKVGEALLKEGDFKKAAEFFQQSIKFHKETDSKKLKARSLWGLGNSFMNMDEGGDNTELQEKAKEQFDRAVTVDPNMIAAYLNLITIYKKTGQDAKAKEIMQKAVKIAPQKPEEWMDLFFFYLRDGSSKKAIFALSKAIAKEPDNPLTYFLAGEAFVKHRIHKEAVKYLEKCVELYPSELRVYNFLGISYRHLEQHKKSVENYQKAIQLDSKDPNVHYNLAKAYLNANDPANAKKAFNEALKINPEFEEAKNELAKLA